MNTIGILHLFTQNYKIEKMRKLHLEFRYSNDFTDDDSQIQTLSYIFFLPFLKKPLTTITSIITTDNVILRKTIYYPKM